MIPEKRRNFLSVYKPILILLYVCGFDLKIFKFKPAVNGFFKICFSCLLVSVIYSSVICYIIDMTYHIWSLLEYGLSIAILMFYKSKLLKFCAKMTKIDNYLRVNKKHYIDYKNKSIIIIVIFWIVKIIYCGFYFTMFPFNGDIVVHGIVHFSLFALDMNRVWIFLLLNAVRYRLKLLRVRLEEDPECNYYLYAKYKKSYKEDKMKFCLYLYRSIAEMMDLIAPELFNGAIFVSVICSLPKLIMNVYHTLLVIEGHETTDTAGFIIVHICQLCFFLCSPCIVTELYRMEVDKIRLFLMDRIIDEKDVKIKEDAKNFLKYTSIRSLQYKMWRCFPVNICLPIDIASACTTYVIVVINFTHLYD